MHLITTDIYEGAYLLSQGMQLEKLWVNGKNGKRSVIFEFVGPQVELLRNDYEKGKASANVTKLKQSLTELKDRMFNLIRSEKSEPQRGEDPANGGREERRQNHEQRSAISV